MDGICQLSTMFTIWAGMAKWCKLVSRSRNGNLKFSGFNEKPAEFLAISLDSNWFPIKFAIAGDGAQQEIKVANTKVGEWEELTFDFSGYIGLVEAIDIDQIIIFPDFDTAGRGQDNVVYIDNIRFE